MIRITDSDGRATYLAPTAIASVADAGTSSQWHGILSFVRTFDGRTIEARETAAYIAAQIEDVAQ